MSAATIIDIYDAIWDALTDDATLKAYVREYRRDVGLMTSSPFLGLTFTGETAEPETLGGAGGTDKHDFRFVVDVKISSKVPADIIDGDGKHPGIHQFAEDVRSALLYRRFDGLRRSSFGTASAPALP